MQSNYMPWKGYFDLIHEVDLFVFYDCNQYTVRDWRNRNRIKTATGLQWITVPCGADRNRLIHDVQISDSAWQVKHFEALRQNYGKCPHFEHYRPWLEAVYLGQRWQSLSDLNQATTTHIAREFLGIQTAFADSRVFQAQGQKQDKIMDLVLKTSATQYLSGTAARDYLHEEPFLQAGVDLLWMDYDGYPEYAQRFGDFEHGVSILDLLFNVGPEAPRYIWQWRDPGPARSRRLQAA